MGRRDTLPERTTQVDPLMVGNQSHKSVKVVYPTAQLCKGTVDEGQPYKLPVGKLKHGHNDKLLEGWE